MPLLSAEQLKKVMLSSYIESIFNKMSWVGTAFLFARLVILLVQMRLRKTKFVQ